MTVEDIKENLNLISLSIDLILKEEREKAVIYERERIRSGIAQYALDNHMSVEDVQPYIDIVGR